METKGLVYSEGSVVLTNSILVAKKFDRNHRDVLDTIRELVKGCAENSADPMFEETKYIHPQNGQEYPMFVMNRDGFTLLAMGFTGDKALRFKLDYMAAFNKMEKALKEPRELSRKELALMVIQAEEEKERLMLENKAQANKIAEDAPKVEFHDNIVASDDTCLVRELAKILTQRGYKIGQNQLYKILRNEGYLIKGGSDRNQPTQQYVENGIFEVDRKPWTNPKTGEKHIGKTSKVTAKGIKYFVLKFLGKAAVL